MVKATVTKKRAVKKTPSKKEAVKVEKPVEKVAEVETKEEILAEAMPATLEDLSDKTDDNGKKIERYFEGVGRRKTSTARVRLYTKPGDFLVHNKHYTSYFPTQELQRITEEALQKMKLFGRFKITVLIHGGGIHSQAEAIRHGLARCLVIFNPDFRKRLKRAGYLKRDPRMKERKKFGLKKARKAPQWAKR